MKRLKLTIILIALFQTAFTQIEVEGKILTSEQKPIVYATITLLDSSKKIIANTVSDEQGIFIFKDLQKGKLTLQISMTGFEQHQQPLVLTNSIEPLATGNIVLQKAIGNLQNVTVAIKKKFIEVRADRTILNIEQHIMASGSSVFEMIKKGPAISSDKDDNLKLKGAVAQIYIDGKPANLSGQSLTGYLKNLPADMVSKIEIIASPNSSFEAQGSAGIINIKLKKSDQQGLNGTVNIGMAKGRYGKVNGGLNLNFRQGKWNVFTNINGGIYKTFNELTLNNIATTNTGVIY
jgi:hypothetical protein